VEAQDSKSGCKKQATFTLSNYSLLYPLLQEVPPSAPGPILKGEHGLPQLSEVVPAGRALRRHS
jgi:hypothetical protein